MSPRHDPIKFLWNLSPRVNTTRSTGCLSHRVCKNIRNRPCLFPDRQRSNALVTRLFPKLQSSFFATKTIGQLMQGASVVLVYCIGITLIKNWCMKKYS